ncbi:hypothetical protein HP567_013025 [Brevibacillus sp. M2.1A]|uniref:hypothetical protein n=1 Tax=Brevibacillus sp. M2.1A TaxID=2738980 RepID=UPI00156B43EF|nr:hypothetical protein [Brevibacillus sp. M2.1A]MCC8435468.1 hypothetical protein [Brevibacillus sp. M2.1A]
MSNVDVNKYIEVANEAAIVLQDIMGSSTSGPVARAIAASTLLHHCESVVGAERLKAKARAKSCKRPVDHQPTVNVHVQKTTDVDPAIIYENVRKLGMNVEEAMKLGRSMY